MHLYEVLRRPLITEKSTVLQAEDKYAFEVAVEANKPQIKRAVEKSFNVTVTGVRVMTMPGKRQRVRGREVSPRPWKKAIVTVEPGDKIGFFEGV